MPEPDEFRSYLSFRSLGGVAVSHGEIAGEISKWPLDGILGFLGALSLDAIQNGAHFLDPNHQGPFLNWAIADDFPVELPGSYKMYTPGGVPATGGNPLFIHEHNIAWVSHCALLHARDDLATPELSYELRRRFFRLLLIANDFFSSEEGTVPSTLRARRNFVFNWLRYGQFNKFGSGIEMTIISLARQWVLMQTILPKHFPRIESAFLDATGGVSLQRYFEILALFIVHFYKEMSPDRRWLSKDKLSEAVKANRDLIEITLKRWIRTPSEYRQAWQKWKDTRSTEHQMTGWDYVPLRETPLIEARPGELITPVVTFVLAKIVDEPFFILSDYFRDRGGVDRFQQALGAAYAEYAHGLVVRIGNADSRALWRVSEKPHDQRGVELADSYMQKGHIAIALEHKGGRPGTEFLRGGIGDRVLGPSDDILDRLDKKEEVTLKEGRDHDHGLLTRGMWQQSIAGPSLVAWAEKELGSCPKLVFPVITHLSDLRADRLSRIGYLAPLIKRARLYQDQFWAQVQWLHVSDLAVLS